MAANPVEPDLLRNLLPCWTWPGSAPKPCRPSPEPSPEPCGPDQALHQSLPDPGTLLNLTWLCTKASPTPRLPINLLRNPVEPDLALRRNLLQNPVEPELAMHPSLPEPSVTFFGTLLNLTWLFTKASRADLLWNLHGNPVGSAPNPPRPSPEPFSETCSISPRSAPKPPRPSPEPSPEPCWTWPGSAPKPLRPSPEPSPELYWTWPGRNPVDLAKLCTKASQTFSGTFFGILLNIAWLGSAPKPLTFSGTFGTFSGTSLNLTRRLHQCTPELFWAEDPISSHCWGKLSSMRARFNILFCETPVMPENPKGCLSIDLDLYSSWKLPCLVKWSLGTKFQNYERLNFLTRHYINNVTSLQHHITFTRQCLPDMTSILHYITLHYATIHYIKAQYISSTNNSLFRQNITSATYYLNNSLR